MKKEKYEVKEKYIRCVVTDLKGRHVLRGASQRTLKRLYEIGNQNGNVNMITYG